VFCDGEPPNRKMLTKWRLYILFLPILYEIQRRRRNKHAHAQRKKQRNKERERLFALFLYSPSRKNEIYVGYKKKPACSCKFRVVF